jgi:hypothetical protein
MQALNGRRGIFAGLMAFVVAGLAAISGAGATSVNTDLTDIWWNPAESGWGMQMVNTGTYVFATIYVYGPDETPTWYTGELRKVGIVEFVGPLYANTGPYYAHPFDRSAKSRQVGTMQFVLSGVNTGELVYTVDGVEISKPVQRTPLTADNYNGTYIVGYTQTVTDCLAPADNKTTAGTGQVTITQDPDATAVVLSDSAGGTCVLVGTFSQLGRMGLVMGNYSCTSGDAGAGTILEMNNAPFMFTARLRRLSTNTGCNTQGEIAGVIPR